MLRRQEEDDAAYEEDQVHSVMNAEDDVDKEDMSLLANTYDGQKFTESKFKFVYKQSDEDRQQLL